MVGLCVCPSKDVRSSMSYWIEGAIRIILHSIYWWWLNGEDLRKLQLHERKRRLRKVIPCSKRSRLRFSDHIVGTGCEVLRAACDVDLQNFKTKTRALHCRLSPEHVDQDQEPRVIRRPKIGTNCSTRCTANWNAPRPIG